jgi:hypothetical protein
MSLAYFSLLLTCSLVTACAAPRSATPSHVVPPHTEPAPGRLASEYELQVLDPMQNTTTRELFTGDTYVSVGIAWPRRGDAPARIVRVDRDRLVTLLAVPETIAGVPAHLRRFDVHFESATDPDADPVFFTVVVSTHDSATRLTYRVRWTLTWNSVRGTFDITPASVTSEAPGPCLTCNNV